MWYQVSVVWTAREVQNKDSVSALMLKLMAPWHAAAITPATGSDGWGTTVSVRDSSLRQAVGYALVVVTSSARRAGMFDVEAVEVHARPQPTPPGITVTE